MGKLDSLVVSDLQIPFHDPKALDFCYYIKRHYKIADENCFNVGDESDNYFGGMWDKSPDADHTANQEIKACQEEFKRWYDRFPKMKLCQSNHGTRWMRKAFAAQIPSQMIRSYREIINAPDGWVWKKYWKVDSKHPWQVEHGDDWGGQTPHKLAALHNGRSTAMGHHHSLAGIEHLKTNGMSVWGMVTGCLIDFETYAFDYARSAKLKPVLGIGLVVDEGKTPIWLPY